MAIPSCLQNHWADFWVYAAKIADVEWIKVEAPLFSKTTYEVRIPSTTSFPRYREDPCPLVKWKTKDGRLWGAALTPERMRECKISPSFFERVFLGEEDMFFEEVDSTAFAEQVVKFIKGQTQTDYDKAIKLGSPF